MSCRLGVWWPWPIDFTAYAAHNSDVSWTKRRLRRRIGLLALHEKTSASLYETNTISLGVKCPHFVPTEISVFFPGGYYFVARPIWKECKEWSRLVNVAQTVRRIQWNGLWQGRKVGRNQSDIGLSPFPPPPPKKKKNMAKRFWHDAIFRTRIHTDIRVHIFPSRQVVSKYTVSGKMPPPQHVEITLWIENYGHYFFFYVSSKAIHLPLFFFVS